MSDMNPIDIFAQESYRKIQIAVAVALLKSKPDNIPAVEYAKEFQRKFIEQTQSKSKSVLELEQKVLSLEQELALSKLWRGSNEANTSNSFSHEESFASADDMGIFEDFIQHDTNNASTSIEDCVTNLNTSSVDTDAITETNLKFIQAIIQLKSTLNSCSTLTVPQFHDILSNAPVKYPLLENTFQNSSSVIKNQVTHAQNSIDMFGSCSLDDWSQDTQHRSDSGFGSLPSGSSGVGSISSSALKYIIRSSNIDQVLHKSVESVLTYLETSILSDDPSVLEQFVCSWTGSIQEYVVSVLVELVDCISAKEDGTNDLCTICLNFLKKIIDRIGKTNDTSSYSTLEHQSVIIVEFCRSIHLCVDTIDYLVEQIWLASQNLKSDATPPDGSQFAERTFYLFHLLEMLLNKHDFNKVLKSDPKSKPSEYSNVMELWKASWSTDVNDKLTQTSHESFMKRILKWKDKLEESLKTVPDEYSNFSLYTLTSLLNIEQTQLVRREKIN